MKRGLALIALWVSLAATAGAQRTMLWQIKSRSSQKVSYLMGSFHQMGNSFIDERPIIKGLLLKSELAIFESAEDRGEKIVRVMQARPEDFSYRKALDTADVAALERYASSWAVPISKQQPAELLVKLQQQYVETYCGTIRPGDSAKHMDSYLLNMSRAAGIAVAGLETFEDQFAAINASKDSALSWSQAKAAVHFWIVSLEHGSNNENICAAAQRYLKMKFDYQLKETCSGDDHMVQTRNERWIPQIEAQVTAHSCFITVGIFHLYGACGLIAQLRLHGYEVIPVSIR